MLLKSLKNTLVLSVIFLTACATTGEKADAQKMSSIKKIGVISMIGDQIHRRYIGITVFNNEADSRDISAWNINEEYEKQIQGELAKIGQYEVVGESRFRKDFNDVYTINGPYDAPAFRFPNWDAIQPKLMAFAAENSVDAFIVVVGSPTNEVGGLGLFGQNRNAPTIYLAAHVALIDGKSGKLISEKILATDQDVFAGFSNKTTPKFDITRELILTKLDEVDDKTFDEFHLDAIVLPKNAWGPTLRALLGVDK